MKVKATEFAQLDEQAQAERSDALNDSGAPAAAGQATVRKKIASFEERHGMSSDEMLRGVSNGEINETASISQWLVLLDALKDSQQRAAL
ncbi:hypothetical protein [Salinibacter ruber]|uniref:hypothetical protein n=1 Tax=Salinibacter ruber TaxID=146919 RepID=UPI0013C35E18|nr:hypothetical protein [Salinibacter ruber]